MGELNYYLFIKMKTSLISILFAFFAMISFASCEENAVIDPADKGNLSIEFDNRYGLDELMLGLTEAKNLAGEKYTVSTLNYFVSNIKLTRSNGEVLTFPDQYFLVREVDEKSQLISLNDIPAGDYVNLTYTIGVDSLKSIADVSARKGVLDPASYGNDNMYWSWNMGYIFFKIEGNAEVVTNNAEGKFEYHIGGFGGKDAVTPNNLKEVSLNLTNNAKVRKGEESTIHVIFDINKVFEGEKMIKLAEFPSIHNPKVGLDVSKNYVKGFTVDHVHN